MANILGIFTTIALLVAVFVAVKNKKAYELEITNNQTAARNLAISEERLKTAQEILAALPVERAGVDEQFEAKSAEETALREGNESLNSQIASKNTKISENQGQLDDIRAKTAGIGEISQLADKMKTMRSELAELSSEIDNNEATLANLTSQINVTDAEADARKAEFEIFSRGESLPNARTTIRTIYPTWGFVTLNSGDNAGIVANSSLEVVRGDEVVAKLLVTAVESSTASASIVPDSQAEDTTLMVGDRVRPARKAAN